MTGHLRSLLPLVLVLVAGPVFAQTPITVHVFTTLDPSGLVALEDSSKERTTAVADMKKRLAKNPAIRLVESAADAKVSIEVVGAGAEWTHKGSQITTYVGGGTAVTTPGTTTPNMVARAVLKSGTFDMAFDAGLGPFGRSYGENLGRKVEDWLKKNAAALNK